MLAQGLDSNNLFSLMFSQVFTFLSLNQIFGKNCKMVICIASLLFFNKKNMIGPKQIS